jgi:hypothetical protein
MVLWRGSSGICHAGRDHFASNEVIFDGEQVSICQYAVLTVHSPELLYS